MKTNVSRTSIEAYHLHIAGDKEESQEKIVLDVIRQLQPCTGRMIWKKLLGSSNQMENSSIARTLNNLKNADKPQIKFVYNDKCPVTNVKVQFYSLIQNEGQQTIF